ncbi:SpoU rRNA Methylase family protein [Sphingobacterium psychroaquaticum]|uniref:SpoU rRNA Methylase family protein n=2 Tax=Sphingobacterium psychroaquaticum TaxID=561061 RepID=A0A1X7KM37_9SPHI|nr:SpoU rRNA Methylase family protein [Sphingobacterium psychroaquaticum]
MDQLNRPDVDAFKNLQKTPIIVVLDNVRSLHNVGSAFRTGDGFAIEKIMLCGITGTPPHREIEKTALGATQSITWSYHKDVAEAIQQAQAEGAKIVAIEQAEGSIPLQEFTISEGEKYALFFGNEVHGVSEEVMEQADACIEIPQFGTKHSLNVSVTIGIVLWDLVGKMKLV